MGLGLDREDEGVLTRYLSTYWIETKDSAKHPTTECHSLQIDVGESSCVVQFFFPVDYSLGGRKPS